MDNSSNNIENLSSKYYDACSNSKEINELLEENNKKIKDSKIDETMKEDEIKNIYESPQRNNNNTNNCTNNSTGIYSTIPSNLGNNLALSTKDQSNKGTETNQNKPNIKKGINIRTMNLVKKNLMSPIDETNENLNNNNTKQFDFSINSKEKLTSNLNTINEITNNNNNVNINIIINKRKQSALMSQQDINSVNKIKKNKHKNKKEEIINTNINQESISLYSSLDNFSNSTTLKKNEKPNIVNKNIINHINDKSSQYSDLNSIRNKIFGNSISESLIKNKTKKHKFDFFHDMSSLMINSISFDDVAYDILTVEDLKTRYNLRDIPVKRKENFSQRNTYLKTLIELQIFNFGDSPIWVIKMSHNGKYLAAGNRAGKIRIYEIMGYDYDKYEANYSSKTLMNYLHFVNEKAIKELSGHTKDITDLAWSPFRHDFLLSSSVDNLVILWDISKKKNCQIETFKHNDYVTCVQFSPVNDGIFATGCFDKFIRIYNINNICAKNKNNMRESIQQCSAIKIKESLTLVEKITSMSFYPDGTQLAIGTINGRINIYDFDSLNNKIRFNHNFACKNKFGKKSLGKKVTSINFINKKNAIISTCDSSIRLVSMDEGKYLSKYKGNVNENYMIKSDFDFSNDIIITGSENGFCYTWNILPVEGKYKKNYYYESFKPIERDVVECAIIVDEKCYTNYFKKILKLTNKINIISIFINSTDNGKIEVLLNIDAEND